MKLLPAALALAALAAGAPSLTAQMVHSTDKMSPPQRAMQATLYALRDSLQLVDAARARIARDLRGASDAALRSRARVMSERCQAASTTVRAARDSVTRSDLPPGDSLHSRTRLVRALASLGADMENCSAEFARLARPEQAEELRGYGIGKGERVSEAIRRFQPAVQTYFEVALGTRFMPNLRGAGAIPSATTP